MTVIALWSHTQSIVDCERPVSMLNLLFSDHQVIGDLIAERHIAEMYIVGSTEAPSKAFLLFFLFSDWIKSNHLRSRIERGFLDIFRAMSVAL